VKLRDQKVVVCGGGGFIGGHLVKSLLANGVAVVRSVDIKPSKEWYQEFSQAENMVVDLKEKDACQTAVRDADVVFNLAADMGGMGFIENNKALCMLSVLINTHLLLASRNAGVKRFFFASSACVYNGDKQRDPKVTPLKEEDAYPALPEDGYGWEKLFSERMCRHFEEDFGLQCRVARFHNVYGPQGTYDGGREKLPLRFAGR
jgi:GDP-D-mannose 3',5'-epimerase